jgi:hypothetical protein
MRFKKLPDEMAQAVKGLNEIYGTPEEFGITFMLGIVNSAVAPYYKVESYKYGSRSTVLYLLGLADTGIGKGTIERELTEHGQRIWLDQQADRNVEIKRDYKTQSAIYKKKHDEWLKGVAADKIDPMDKSLEPKPPTPLELHDHKLEKGTTNGFLELFKTRSFLILQGSEGGEFFNSHSLKDANSTIEMSAAMTKLWEGDDLDKNTAIDSFRLRDRVLTINLMTQKDTVLDILRNPILKKQGILNRFLWAETGRVDGKEWLDTKEEEERIQHIRDTMIKPFHDRVYNMYKSDFKYKDDKFDTLRLEKEVIESTKDAKALLIDQLYNRYRFPGHPQYDGSILTDYPGFSERIHENGIRIAATIARFRGHAKIELNDAECAVELMEFYIQQREQFEIPGFTRDPETLENANRIWDWIQRKQWSGHIGDLYNRVRWFKSIGREDRERILGELVAIGRLTMNKDTRVFSIK